MAIETFSFMQSYTHSNACTCPVVSQMWGPTYRNSYVCSLFIAIKQYFCCPNDRFLLFYRSLQNKAVEIFHILWTRVIYDLIYHASTVIFVTFLVTRQSFLSLFLFLGTINAWAATINFFRFVPLYWNAKHCKASWADRFGRCQYWCRI